jgi:lysine 2,3-aminomutase
VMGREESDLLLRNYEGRVFRYPDPGGRVGAAKQRTDDYPNKIVC